MTLFTTSSVYPMAVKNFRRSQNSLRTSPSERRTLESPSAHTSTVRKRSVSLRTSSETMSTCQLPLLIGGSSLQGWKLIGSGGFGQIFKARHREWGCEVAVKLLRCGDG
ncbi:Receptor-interacting serine/threonine-protein kinase 3 [Liparis tanakae]|uniref:Receptor-interacting serine/threonine-protein kinase 3 n=1 Tax=Liparis tanakae TaxID=230148 RepID=A0A4Z2GJE8_9TELE|nr:Receptor-interacting serine/threonine-protein kinase 3 [Liparis tanakae]